MDLLVMDLLVDLLVCVHGSTLPWAVFTSTKPQDNGKYWVKT